MLSGLHAPNTTPIENSIKNIMRAGQFEAVKLMHYHTAEDIRRIREANPRVHLMMRLPDSVRDDGTIPSWQDHAERCAQIIKWGLSQCITEYTCDNESNLVPQWHGRHWEWQWFWSMCLDGIRVRVNDPRLRLGLAPLAWNPDTWRNVETGWIPAMRRIVARFDAVCIHAYWQYSKHVLDQSFGGNIPYLVDKLGLKGTNKPVWVTEYGCSLGDARPRPSKEVIEAAMKRDYPTWLAWARSLGYVEAAYCFISEGATPDWDGFAVSQSVASAMAA